MSRNILLSALCLMLWALPVFSQSYIPPENRPRSSRAMLATNLMPAILGEGFNLNYTFNINPSSAISYYVTLAGKSAVDKPNMFEIEAGWETALSGVDMNVYFLHFGLSMYTRDVETQHTDIFGRTTLTSQSNGAMGFSALAGKRWIFGAIGVSASGGLRVVASKDFQFTESSIFYSDSPVQLVLRVSGGIAF